MVSIRLIPQLFYFCIYINYSNLPHYRYYSVDKTNFILFIQHFSMFTESLKNYRHIAQRLLKSVINVSSNLSTILPCEI